VGWSRISSVGLKLGRCRISLAVLRRPRCRDGSRKLGFKPNPKKAKRFFLDQVCGLDEVRLDSGMSGLGSSALEALDGSTSTLPVFKLGSSWMGVLLRWRIRLSPLNLFWPGKMGLGLR
jgi:hypothetical protein